MLFDAHWHAFRVFGGVPRRGIYDNMRTAVDRVKTGKNRKVNAMQRLEALSDRFASVRHADGYSHASLDGLLADVDIGVIPVLWEDNLPQVAIEMHARHIPLITSDFGGAQELGATKGMVFRAGEIDSFHDILFDVMAGRIDPAAYWRNARTPPSMADHTEALRALYRRLSAVPMLAESGQKTVSDRPTSATAPQSPLDRLSQA